MTFVTKDTFTSEAARKSVSSFTSHNHTRTLLVGLQDYGTTYNTASRLQGGDSIIPTILSANFEVAASGRTALVPKE